MVEKVYSDPMDPLGLNSKIDFEEVTYEFDNRIEALKDEWFHRVEAHMDRNGSLSSLVREMRLMGYEDPQCIFRHGLLKLWVTQTAKWSMRTDYAIAGSSTTTSSWLSRSDSSMRSGRVR